MTEINSKIDETVELVWRDLAGLAPRPRIQEIVAEVFDRCRDARITTYVPIFVRRETRERLSEEIRLAEQRL